MPNKTPHTPKDHYVLARDLLIKPVVSEKSYGLLDENKYTFIVHPDANKEQIRDAVELLFDVKVTGVNTINRKGKRKRTRAGFGKRPDTRRAIVSVDPNPKDASKKSRIDIFGGPAS
jgi:large subunit ribosomal protein L23